jgi:hypothetical protein
MSNIKISGVRLRPRLNVVRLALISTVLYPDVSIELLRSIVLGRRRGTTRKAHRIAE